MPETMNLHNPHHPWLEYLPEGGDRVKKAQIDRDTFTIGRSDAADVQIDSTRVSREHARILRRNGKYFIRDLESTNGTFVNGERIEENELSAGDVIVVADTEFAFLMDSVSRLRRMKTKQMTSSVVSTRENSTISENPNTREAVLALRTAQEQLCQHFVHLELTSVLEVPEGNSFALMEDFVNGKGISARKQSSLLQPPSHALIRLREAHRLETIKRCAALPECNRVIVPLEPWEIHDVDSLAWHFEAMISNLTSGVMLFASVNASDAADLTEVQEFCGDLTNMGIAICCHDFVGSHVHVEHLAELRPELIMLANEMSLKFDDKPQNRERLSSVVETCKTLGIRPIVTGGNAPISMEQLTELNIDLFLHGSMTHDENSSDSGRMMPALAASACN